jgi:hypothetical protein
VVAEAEAAIIKTEEVITGKVAEAERTGLVV